MGKRLGKRVSVLWEDLPSPVCTWTGLHEPILPGQRRHSEASSADATGASPELLPNVSSALSPLLRGFFSFLGVLLPHNCALYVALTIARLYILATLDICSWLLPLPLTDCITWELLRGTVWPEPFPTKPEVSEQSWRGLWSDIHACSRVTQRSHWAWEWGHLFFQIGWELGQGPPVSEGLHSPWPLHLTPAMPTVYQYHVGLNGETEMNKTESLLSGA